MRWIIVLYGLGGHPLPAADQFQPDRSAYTTEAQCETARDFMMRVVEQWSQETAKPVMFTAKCEKREIRS